MKHCDKRRLELIVACLVTLPLVACTGLPTSAELEKKHTSTTEKLCESSKEEALGCARFLRDQFAALEARMGRWETGYAITAVGLGSVTAVYLKSATDRSQALEDLAVGVATLAGLHQVLKPSERLKLGTEGRKAVECMILSVEAITVFKAEADAEVAAATGGSEKAANLRQAFENKRTTELKLMSARQTLTDGTKQPAFARLRIAEQLHSAEAEANTAEERLRSLRSDAVPLTPMQRFEIGIDREFGLEETHRLARSSGTAPIASAQLQKFARGLLLQQQGRQLAAAKNSTRAAAKAADADSVVAQRLAFGLHQLLNNARLAISNLAAPADNLVIAQRDAVRTMIGDLAKTVTEEQKQGERTIGATNAAADADDTNASASDAAAEAHSAGRVQLQQVFEQCAGGPN